MNDEKQLTPKERYDAEMKQINKTLAPKEDDGIAESEVEEIEVEMEQLDKSMGEEKVTVSQQQFLSAQAEKQKQEILNKFTGGSIKRERLSTEQSKVMAAVLKEEQEGLLEDPVLKHLVGKKIEIAKEMLEVTARIKEIQMKIVKEMGELADESMTLQSSVDTYNRDILLYVQKNPKVLKTDLSISKGASFDYSDNRK